MLGSRKVVILEDKHVLVETFNVLKLIYFVQNLIAIAGRAFRRAALRDWSDSRGGPVFTSRAVECFLP